MLKIFSWNVNGIRAVIKKGALQKFIKEQNPDILCLQETKAKRGQAEIDFSEYEEIWNSAERPGYAGTAIFTKIKPLATREYRLDKEIKDGFGDALKEGRVLVAEFEKFFLVDVYTPNSKPDLSRLSLRENEWDPGFLEYLKELEKEKPVVACGDFNAAHEEIDLARPKTNHHSAGFTDEERAGISNLIKAGFIDTFRFLNPAAVRYTWWSHWGNARANNVGWRIDYFFISKGLKKNLKSAEIYEDYFGSDHCPISIELEI
ncbi:exodeoxyribonuclease III [Candidatus Saccharibacteria bacterium]|nr:exodeoxyribonuclease III [Candidatus Saccharibacteria bacterium]MDO5474905.1 exodeoxyribonuclease III [Candidatus Saccharibacteria bacterium]